MADELKGKIYEVLSIIAIRKYSNIISTGENLFWNEQPCGINVEPDITVGKSPNEPRLLMLVTHTAAERASDKKFWRNMGEFVDARLTFGDSIRIVSVNFDSAQKRRLASASDLMFDGMIEVDRTEYGDRLIAFANQLVCEFEPIKATLDTKAAMIEAQVADGREIELVKLLAQDLERISSMESTNSKGWYAAFASVQKKRDYCYIPERKCTYIRRGVGRLLPIDDKETVELILASIRNKNSLEEVPDYFCKLGLATKTIGGYRITQQIPRGKTTNVNELFHIPETLSDDEILSIWQAARGATTALKQICDEIKTGIYTTYNKFIVDNYSSLINPESMARALKECFYSPNKVLDYDIREIPNDWRAWLFDYVMTLIKAHTGKQQGYGYSRLVVDSGLYIPGKRSILDFVLPMYNSRTKMIDDYVLKAVAEALSKKLSVIGQDWIKDNGAITDAFYLQVLFEDKIYKAAFFDPIQTLLTAKVPDVELIPRFPTVLSDLLDSQNSTCYVLAKSKTIIMWQSAYDANCGHKFNELVGRMGMLRTKADNDIILPRNTVLRSLLVIDGTWSQKHIQCLYNAGFDGIFYPDEIDKLKAAIV